MLYKYSNEQFYNICRDLLNKFQALLNEVVDAELRLEGIFTKIFAGDYNISHILLSQVW